jgi:phage baseplate assembly protein W
MAVILGQKRVIDTKEYSDYAIGLSLPLQIGKTAFNQTYNTVDQVKTNIKSLLLTKRQERVMQPFLGSGLHEVLFEMNDEQLVTKIEDTITEAVSFWLPFVNISEIVVTADNNMKDNNTVEVSIDFTIGNDAQLNQVTFAIGG